MYVLRVHHAARDSAQRLRECALERQGVEIALVIPTAWPTGPSAAQISQSRAIPLFEFDVARAGDVNRHSYEDEAGLRNVLRAVQPDVLDIHEEPFSLAARQWLRATPDHLPVVMYAAQNIDKRFPPPFSSYEGRALRRASGLYPCSQQAASVARGKGFAGLIDVIPLGYDPTTFSRGDQSLDDDELRLGVSGRFVPEKGIRDAVYVLHRLQRMRPSRLILVGDGPEGAKALDLAARLGLHEHVEIRPWLPSGELAELYRSLHVLLVPSKATARWGEQFGRVIVEAQASGAVVAGYASGAIPEVAGAPGILAPEGRVDVLARRIVEVVTSREDWWARREAGIELSKQRTWEAVAARQVELYARVIAGTRPATLPRDPMVRRSMAEQEFGPTASTPAGRRPFAFPPLRRGGPIARWLGRGIDLSQAAWAGVSPIKK